MDIPEPTDAIRLDCDVLVIGAEQMSRVSPKEVGTNLLKASYVSEEAALPGGFAGIFGVACRVACLVFNGWR